MKILEINTQRIWRGGEQQTYYITKGLFEKGVDVSLLCLKNSIIFSKSIESGLSVIGVDSDLDILRYLLTEGKKYEVIHCQTSKAQKFAVITKFAHRRPIVFTRRVGFPLKGIGTKIKYKLTDKVVAITDKGKRMISEFLPSSDVEVIPDCLVQKKPDIKRAESLKRKLNIENKKIIGTTTALTPVKDPFTFVKAIMTLYKKRRDFIVLHFGEGKLFNQVKDEVIRNGLEGVYYLMGFDDRVVDFYPIFDVFVITSHMEVLCNSVLEAFMYKVPVVSTEAEGLRELVQDRGILCPVNDYYCISHAIDRLLDDSTLRKQFIDRAYSFVVENFQYDRIIERYIHLFRRIVKKEI